MEARHEKIVQLLENHAVLNVHELCNLLSVSPATIRRDLTKMEELGLIKRMHGGAVLQKPSGTASGTSLNAPLDPYIEKKQAIAEAAFTMVKPGDTIFIDAGSTTEQMTPMLSTLSDISIVTNSIEIAYNMYKHRDRISTYVCGGTLGSPNPHASIVGPMAEQMISQFKANICFIGTQALDMQHGITEPYLSIARIKEKMISNSFKVVLIADSSKFGKVKQAFVCPLDRIHHLITDDGAPEADIQAIRDLGIQVTVISAREDDQSHESY